jgi:hypothetical protein
VRDAFDRGVALLHSFWYAVALDAFNAVAKQDPSCAMAHWGAALSIWGNPLGGTDGSINWLSLTTRVHGPPASAASSRAARHGKIISEDSVGARAFMVQGGVHRAQMHECHTVAGRWT